MSGALESIFSFNLLKDSFTPDTEIDAIGLVNSFMPDRIFLLLGRKKHTKHHN